MLKTFGKPDFHILQSWVTSKEMLFQFSATEFHYPLSWEQWQAYQQKFPERRQYLAMHESHAPYAFGEIIPQDAQSVRLSRLLVGETKQRGKGLGGILIQELISEATRQFDMKRVDLFVLADNQGAIRCYQKAGFVFVEAPPIELEFEDEKYPIMKMSRNL